MQWIISKKVNHLSRDPTEPSSVQEQAKKFDQDDSFLKIISELKNQFVERFPPREMSNVNVHQWKTYRFALLLDPRTRWGPFLSDHVWWNMLEEIFIELCETHPCSMLNLSNNRDRFMNLRHWV